MTSSLFYDTWEQRAQAAAQPHEANVKAARKALAGLDRFGLEAIAEAAVGMLNELAGDVDLEDGCDEELSEGWSARYDCPEEVFVSSRTAAWPPSGDALTPIHREIGGVGE